MVRLMLIVKYDIINNTIFNNHSNTSTNCELVNARISTANRCVKMSKNAEYTSSSYYCISEDDSKEERGTAWTGAE